MPFFIKKDKKSTQRRIFMLIFEYSCIFSLGVSIKTRLPLHVVVMMGQSDGLGRSFYIVLELPSIKYRI